jgi:hypothetical protein
LQSSVPYFSADAGEEERRYSWRPMMRQPQVITLKNYQDIFDKAAAPAFIFRSPLKTERGSRTGQAK